MHPASSIIVFTVLSGLGYGLAAFLGLGLLDPSAFATKVAYISALVLIAGGLLSSTLHLGNPRRAWRAFSQWRSSWLSREGVLSVLVFVPLAMSAWLCAMEGRYSAPIGIAGSLLSLATVFCTSMIYASLKSVQAWHTRLTSACYLLFSLAGGALLGSAFGVAGSGSASPLSFFALVLLISAWTVKIAWLRHLDSLKPLSTPESATGLGAVGRVRLFERPHVTENYLTSEMGFRVARKHAAKLRKFALLLGGLLPGALVFLVLAALLAGAEAGGAAILALMAASLSHIIGMLAERWLFFAEARHAVMNYYGG
ncbi:DMSO reductase [Mesorhizobium loti]|nr:DmsC/YnfH family molybdoenzyme membrane anchor subunit [Mesorhizobium loti]PLP60594.1 DMSO reductase [Mesorhizobium loti]